MGIRISKDHLHPSVIESITSLIGDLDQLETTAKGNAVEAINELLANGGNKEELEALIAEIAEGKELIANAVGEPLTAEESFDEMSNDINSLLSTFKANMMNNGITVESSDKFKSLIDKIATMVEEGSGKGIQFAEGTFPKLNDLTTEKTVTYDLDFTPTMLFVVFNSITNNSAGIVYKFCISNIDTISLPAPGYSDAARAVKISLTNITNESFTILDSSYYTTKDTGGGKWYAIGVGEEDTTVRDSLASILQGEGVSVTEEDDMASLITKIDSEFDRQVVPAGNAIATNVLSGKTFINNTGHTVTGTMANNGAKTFTPSASQQTAPAGYYSGITCNAIAGLSADNIVKGVTVGGVTGTASVAKAKANAGTAISLWTQSFSFTGSQSPQIYTSSIIPVDGKYTFTLLVNDDGYSAAITIKTNTDRVLLNTSVYQPDDDPRSFLYEFTLYSGETLVLTPSTSGGSSYRFRGSFTLSCGSFSAI